LVKFYYNQGDKFCLEIKLRLEQQDYILKRKVLLNMKIDKSFFLKTSLSPWYDSDLVCVIKVLLAFVVVLFGIAGIRVARQIDAYNDFVWVPLFLFALSFMVFVANLVRLVKRYGRSALM
jgi:hypothetical protein